jgi:hypothetical protein
MQSLTFIATAMLIIIAAIMLVLDMIGRADILKRHPKLWAAVTSRPIILLLLLTAIALLDRDYKDAMAVGPAPSVKIYPPAPPVITGEEPHGANILKAGGETTRQTQVGKGNLQTGAITQGPCSNLQVGGANNTQGGNCGPPPLVLTPSMSLLRPDKDGQIKTLITVTPNVDVQAPVNVVLEFDNPVTSIGFWVEGAGSVLGGGPASVQTGTHPVVPVGTGFNPKHALLLTAYSALPLKLMHIHLD